MYYLILIVLVFSLIYRVYYYRKKNFWEKDVFKVSFFKNDIFIDKHFILFLFPLIYIYYGYNKYEFIILSILILVTFFKYEKK